jgi:hypothetical protein
MQRMSSFGAIGVPRLRIAVRDTSPTYMSPRESIATPCGAMNWLARSRVASPSRAIGLP